MESTNFLFSLTGFPLRTQIYVHLLDSKAFLLAKPKRLNTAALGSTSSLNLATADGLMEMMMHLSLQSFLVDSLMGEILCGHVMVASTGILVKRYRIES